jgi:hypothetical protein
MTYDMKLTILTILQGRFFSGRIEVNVLKGKDIPVTGREGL